MSINNTLSKLDLDTILVLFLVGLKYGVATLISGVFFLQANLRSEIIFSIEMPVSWTSSTIRSESSDSTCLMM